MHMDLGLLTMTATEEHNYRKKNVRPDYEPESFCVA